MDTFLNSSGGALHPACLKLPWGLLHCTSLFNLPLSQVPLCSLALQALCDSDPLAYPAVSPTRRLSRHVHLPIVLHLAEMPPHL